MVISNLKLLWHQFQKHDATGLAAQCAYYFLLSLFPFLLFILSLLGYLPFSSDDVVALIKDYIPGAVSSWLEDTLTNLLDVKRGGTLSFGLILALVSASAAMNAIVIAVNKAYGLPERKSFIHSRFLAVMLTLGMLIVIASALLLSVFGHWIGDWVQAHVHLAATKVNVWNNLRWILNFIILFIVFTGIYYIAPNTCLTCKSVLPGALFASLGWQGTGLGFSFYVNNFTNYSATYGSVGGIIVLMTWFYISALLIIIGGEINALKHVKMQEHVHMVPLERDRQDKPERQDKQDLQDKKDRTVW
ncbi:YihY/virulence factor BrkB family protein [Paenibacillus sp. CGMCC 1.16610]|uniref:YihY family inner membrane protein n=1 Tax=Paenibacillus anseongense TaxID=2682845 RepID=A0ABW9UKD2_9BACL|nr:MULTISPECIES: YihY/virulence factor BrkB family protein [Paenibacillus]MBA2942855.1 YihY/virulence factor BrkB family protein [Paenibacillus sp. CGMCC 1.16610]MVQ38340.1 YihY family inner membrane protein [Paenibacillus anseongense]